MRARFINQRMFMVLVRLRNSLLYWRTWYFRTVYGMNIAPDVHISFKSRIDKTNPKGLTIGSETMIAFDSIILAHDFASRRHSAKTVIGKRCFIGCGSIIMPNITLGDNVVVAAGSVVTKDVPSGSIVAGNPAKVIKKGIMTDAYGKLTQEYLDSKEKPESKEKNSENKNESG